MRLTLPKVLAALGITTLIAAATLFYLDSRIPRATATVQLHPAMVVTKPINSNSNKLHPFFGR